MNEVIVTPQKKMIDATKLISVAEYARQIGKTTSRVYQLIREGEVRCQKISGKFFVVKD